MADFLAIVVDPGTADPATLLAAASEAVTATAGVTVTRTYTEPYSGALADEVTELRDRLDKVNPGVRPGATYIELRGGLTYEQCLTVLGWYGSHVTADNDGPADDAVAAIIAPPGVDPLDPPVIEPEP